MDKHYVIELDVLTYQLSGQTLEMKNDFQSVRGCTFLVSDFDKSISRVMHVEADIRYAEAMVVRALQDEGEFDEPVSVITHWKKKRGKKSTEIFFTALPSRVYLSYLDKIKEHHDILVLIPIFSVLANFVNRLAAKEPIAVVFRHGRSADLVIGKNNQFYFATRCIAFDSSAEQIAALWETVSREISTAIQENTLEISRLITLNWIDSKDEDPCLADSLDIEQFLFNKTPVTYGDSVHHISFPLALNMFPSMEGIAPQNGKTLYFLNLVSPFITAFYIIATVALLWGTFSFQSKTKDIISNITPIENRINTLNSVVLSQPQKFDYLTPLTYIDSLFHSRHLPSYKDVINDISMGILRSIKVEQLQIDYQDRAVTIKMTGIIPAGFDSAYKEYQHFVSNLKADGYAIDNNTFNTRIDSSRFELALSRSIK